MNAKTDSPTMSLGRLVGMEDSTRITPRSKSIDCSANRKWTRSVVRLRAESFQIDCFVEPVHF